MKPHHEFPMRRDRPPFALLPGQSAEAAGVDIVTAFATLATLPDCARGVFGALMDALGVPGDEPIARAGARLAAHIDAGGGGGHAHPYHNTRHLCEVMLGAHFIARLQRLPVEATAEVVLAALMHDYGHDGGRNGATPFRLERQSVTLASALFGDAGLDAARTQRLAALVLATEVMRGHVYAIACHAAHESGGASLDAVVTAAPEEAPELALLASDALLARQALVLCEADVLPSVGLTYSHALKMQAELSAEWDTALDARDKLRFIDAWLRESVVSLYFKPNVDLLRQRLMQSVEASS